MNSTVTWVQWYTLFNRPSRCKNSYICTQYEYYSLTLTFLFSDIESKHRSLLKIISYVYVSPEVVDSIEYVCVYHNG